MNNLHTTFDKLLKKEDKEKLLNQKAKTFWFTGLSGSGKTTLAKEIEKRLHKEGYLVYVLDGDNIRSGINSDLSFSLEDRKENIRRISEVSKLFNQAGVICLNCFVSPTINIREMAKDIIGKDNFIEVFINASVEVCESRDVKGLYKKARNGEIKDFTGIDSIFEEPPNPSIVINSGKQSIKESSEELYNFIKNKIKV